MDRDWDGHSQAQERDGDRQRSRRLGKKGLIEAAYAQDALSVWTEDEAGPYQTVPYPGYHWHEGEAVRYPHEYVREGTAKQLTLFHPRTGEVRVKGVRQSTNAILHPWLEEELVTILARLPDPRESLSPLENHARWERWQEGLTVKITLPAELPPLRLLLVLDNLTGHQTPSLVLWLFAHGIMPLYTPLGGSWLNQAESVQRILKRRALDGCHPKTPNEIIDWLEAAARGWNREPTPFEWGGRRRARRERARERRHRLGGSGACTKRLPARRQAKSTNGYAQAK